MNAAKSDNESASVPEVFVVEVEELLSGLDLDALISTLAPWRLKVYDPVVPASAAGHPRAQGTESALAAAEGVDALAIMTPWPAFRELRPADLARVMRGNTVLDPYRVLDGRAAVAAGLDYLTLGAPPRRAKEYRCA